MRCYSVQFRKKEESLYILYCGPHVQRGQIDMLVVVSCYSCSLFMWVCLSWYKRESFQEICPIQSGPCPSLQVSGCSCFESVQSFEYPSSFEVKTRQLQFRLLTIDLISNLHACSKTEVLAVENSLNIR